MSGFRFMSRASDDSIVLVSYHPANCGTWHWGVNLTRKPIIEWGWRVMLRAERRVGQWHDYYRLPFGWTLLVSRQDYHKSGEA